MSRGWTCPSGSGAGRPCTSAIAVRQGDGQARGQGRSAAGPRVRWEEVGKVVHRLGRHKDGPREQAITCLLHIDDNTRRLRPRHSRVQVGELRTGRGPPPAPPPVRPSTSPHRKVRDRSTPRRPRELVARTARRRQHPTAVPPGSKASGRSPGNRPARSPRRSRSLDGGTGAAATPPSRRSSPPTPRRGSCRSAAAPHARTDPASIAGARRPTSRSTSWTWPRRLRQRAACSRWGPPPYTPPPACAGGQSQRSYQARIRRRASSWWPRSSSPCPSRG